MTARSVAEWRGATPDTAIPPRVQQRVWLAAKGRCQLACGRKLGPGDKWQIDHVVALVNGGSHAESNLQIACDWCHKSKTADDVALKSKTARVRAKHLGIRKPPTLRHPRYRRKIDGTVVDRSTGEPA